MRLMSSQQENPYVTNAFKGILESMDGNTFAIHNITRPLFGNIEGGTVKNLLLENVNIDLPGLIE